MQNKVKAVVFNAIGIGHDNATTRSQLRIKTGYNDRLIRQAIEDLRMEYVILNRDDGKGYYIPEPTAAGRRDAAGWITRQNRRIKSIKAATQGAMAFVRPVKDKSITGQMDIFDYMKESGL